MFWFCFVLGLYLRVGFFIFFLRYLIIGDDEDFFLGCRDTLRDFFYNVFFGVLRDVSFLLIGVVFIIIKGLFGCVGF